MRARRIKSAPVGSAIETHAAAVSSSLRVIARSHLPVHTRGQAYISGALSPFALDRAGNQRLGAAADPL
jgi:hypothetical protein